MATTRQCGKCHGTGFLAHHMHVQVGKCFACDGTGTVTVLTAAERAAAERTYARRCTLVRSLSDRAREIGRDAYHDAHAAWDHLETNAPERFARLLDSVEQGRTDQAIACLRKYAAEHLYGK